MASKTPVSTSNAAGSSEPDSFDATARRLLDRAISIYQSNESLVSDEIRDGVKRVVALAKLQGLAAERMLMELKKVWHSVAEMSAQHRPEVISNLVTMCIREFYGNGPESQDD